MSCRKMGGDLERLGATSSSTVYARCAHDAHPDLGLDGTPNTLGRVYRLRACWNLMQQTCSSFVYGTYCGVF